MSKKNNRLTLAKFSNAADAFFVQSFDPWTDIIAVSVLAASAWQIGLLNALTTASFMILGIPIGIFVDRYDGVRVLKTALVTKVLLTSALLLMSVSGYLSISLLLVFATLMGIATVATETAQVSTVPSLSQNDSQIGRAIATIATWDRVATLAGPVAVAFGIVSIGANKVLLAVIGFSIVAMIGAMFIRKPHRVHRSAEPDSLKNAELPAKQSFWTQAKDGWTVLVNDRQLAGMTWLSCFSNAGLALGGAVEAILVIQVLDLGIGFFGILGSIGALSGIAAAFLADQISKSVSVRKLYLWGGLGQVVSAAMPLIAFWVPSAAVGLLIVHTAVWGVILTVTNVSASIYAAVTVDQSLLGRIAALRRSLTMALVPIGSIVGGVLGSSFGIWLPLLLWPIFVLFGVLLYSSLDRSVIKVNTEQ
ncbi:hypothetical protein AOZ07_11485 [Glutamicibacter halophytocola]|uniref:MFS transporter n=1 Tax=Glutamicibacter halophytocola TaxID=1933880 RepID=UPI0006D4B53E|nr:MFS transporter [Glutamicibacter halophytocola]ALG29540.1 hypothetical protein AOZ07_11485 [Glutamicibacter halophytocola]